MLLTYKGVDNETKSNFRTRLGYYPTISGESVVLLSRFVFS